MCMCNKFYVGILAKVIIVIHVFLVRLLWRGGSKNLESLCACAQTLERVGVLTRFWSIRPSSSTDVYACIFNVCFIMFDIRML
jgi:hypothetical protein